MSRYWIMSWNSAHEWQTCSASGLAAMGGASYFYRFAIAQKNA